MRHFFFICSLFFSSLTIAQDTLAVNSIEEAITEAEKGNFISLGLMRDGRTVFPSEFFSIPKSQLIGLVIDNCSYTILPQTISEYTNLIYFRYSWFYGGDCPLTSFPNFLTQAESIQHIKIEGARITEVPALSKLKELEYLSLYMCDIQSFPYTVLELTSLKVLDLSCNDFDLIPSSIDRLSNLRELSFEGGACGATPISRIPSSIGNLTNLESFSLGYTEKPIETLPDSFFNLKNLKHFECHGCGLTSISEKLGNLENLESLQLTNLNSFEEFPEALFSLPKLNSFRFYLYGKEADAKVVSQQERINTWGESLDRFNFDLNLK